MFLLIVQRADRVAVGASGGDKFAARSTTQAVWTVSGPFAKRQAAERAMVNAIGTASCRVAQVIDRERLDAILAHNHDNYALTEALRKFRKDVLGAAAPLGAV